MRIAVLGPGHVGLLLAVALAKVIDGALGHGLQKARAEGPSSGLVDTRSQIQQESLPASISYGSL
jgi:ketopantoate reductase